MNDALGVLPCAILVIGAALVVAFDRLFPADERAAAWLASAIALSAGTAAVFAGTGDDALGGLVRRDGASVFFTSLLCAGSAAAFAVEAGAATTSTMSGRLGQMLLATAGAALLTAAGNLLLVFLALEIVFVSLFALIDATPSPRARAASRSWFVLGGTASALFAAGVGLVWSAGGSLAIGALASATSAAGQAGTALVLVGLACFAGLVPFHLWLLPALEVTPASSAILIAVVPRVAAFAALMECASALSASSGSAIDWRACVAILAAASLAVGSIGALGETSLRRIVAYLAVAFGGQVAVAAAAGVGQGAAIGLALLAYAVVVVGLLGVVALSPADDARLEDLRGFARRRPLLVVAVLILAMGMAGLPPTIAFFARLAVFEGAAGSQLAWLVILAAIATVLTAASGFRIVFACFEAGDARLRTGRVAAAVIALTALIALAGGIAPDPWLQLAQGVRF
jgi:NADH-quinone oxidoreductase subunit N